MIYVGQIVGGLPSEGDSVLEKRRDGLGGGGEYWCEEEYSHVQVDSAV